MAAITLTISDVSEFAVVIATDADRPQVGRPVTPAEALAMTLLGNAMRQGATVNYNPDAVPLVALALDLISPEGYGHAVPLEVRQRAKRALGPRLGQLLRQAFQAPSPGVDIDAVHNKRQCTGCTSVGCQRGSDAP